MCLVKVKQEEDVVVPYRVVQRNHSPPRRRASHQSIRRYSRNEIVRESSPRPSGSYIAVPTPKPLAIPAPQPVPVFVQPPPEPIHYPAPAPPSQHHHHNAHYVEVSPRSSVTSRSSSPGRSEYVYREREVRRERAYSPESSPRYEHFRYVEPAPSESDHYERYQRRDRSRSRQRSRSRGGYDDPRGSYRETNTRVTLVDEDGRRRREYRR
ncbi:Nn.00g098420.m01.CDS01 [Neocucurbitaria sp. VM-36]